MADLTDTSILVIDDDHSSREAIQESLQREGYRVAAARGGTEGIHALRSGAYDLVVTDLVMPGADGMAILDAAKERDPTTEVIILTGFGSVESAVEAMKRGANQYLNKPVNIKELREVARKAIEKQTLARDNAVLRKDAAKRYGFESILGNSPAMQRLFDKVRQVAPTSATVLISGASGTGKELIAHAIHNHSPRAHKPFLAFNCGALVDTLIESELFGHERGAFTGAVSDRKGYFQLADGGTLFLDEIGEMPQQTQVKLLRVLETQSFFRVGGVRKVEVDVRVITATNRSLEDLIAKGQFREDLYFRLKVITLEIPALRERRDDIPILTQAFLSEFRARHGHRVEKFSADAMEAFQRYDWPGNVRELRNLVENLVITARGETVAVDELPSEICRGRAKNAAGAVSYPSGMKMEEIEKEVMRIAIERTGGNKKRAADELGISLRTFHRKVKEYGL